MSEANDLGWFRRSAAERSEGALSNERRQYEVTSQL